MKGARTPLVVLSTLCAGFLLLLYSSSTLLPERVATHFGSSGRPNGWISRSADLTAFAALGTGVVLLFFIITLIVRVVPAQFINLPRREHWLAPERRATTINYLANQVAWMGCLVILFLAAIHLSVIQANHTNPPHLPFNSFIAILACFLLSFLALSLNLLRHFAKAA